MKRIKKIKSKMMAGIFLVFMVSFIVLMINIGANQRVVIESQSLLKDNFPSVKYAFQMLRALDELNILLISPDTTVSKSVTVDSFNQTANNYLKELKNYLILQEKNITEPGEKELTESLRKGYENYQKSIAKNEYNKNFEAYRVKYLHFRENILSIHNINIGLLESKNEEIKNSATRILNVQEKVGIIGLTLLSILIFTLPLLLINPIDKLTERMMNFYKTNFNKEIEIKTNHELEKLEEIFKKIVLETKSGKAETESKKL
ncbi:MAG: hypothetical protein JXA77_00820 [Bacteroidales bacterium]|nr:hypothetical protein [Bacteroidales bacterium]MBN2820790.1 hypothetical protein [Bacteroidales bacterium]